MTVKDGTPQKTLGSLALTEIDFVLVKFYFTNRKHVPPEITEYERKPDRAIDVINQMRAIAAGSDTYSPDRHRPGRVDIGEPVINNLPCSQADLVPSGLIDNDFRLIDIHWFTKASEEKGKRK